MTFEIFVKTGADNRGLGCIDRESGAFDAVIRIAADGGSDVEHGNLPADIEREACDVAVVALEPGADRLAMPSKLQGILASGRPVLVLAPADSELARIVTTADCGIVVEETGDPLAIARAIRKLQGDPARLKTMGENARAMVENSFAVEHAAERYSSLINSL